MCERPVALSCVPRGQKIFKLIYILLLSRLSVISMYVMYIGGAIIDEKI